MKPILPIVLVSALASASCEREASAPVATAAPECCELTPNSALPAGMGRIVVSYPGDGGADATRLEVYAAGDASKALGSEYGNAALEIAPGAYDVTIGGRRVAAVGVQAGHDTRVRVGVLQVHAGDGTRIDFFDPAGGAAIAGGYGSRSYGFPVGSVEAEVAQQRATVTIEDGQVAEF